MGKSVWHDLKILIKSDTRAEKIILKRIDEKLNERLWLRYA